MQKLKIELHYQFFKEKFQQQDINNTLNFILNSRPKMVAK
jgi:hypothetical protein